MNARTSFLFRILLYKPGIQLQTIRNIFLSLPKSMTDHISITADKTRHDTLSPATVTEIKDLSKTVKLLKLNAKDDNFSFKAGQWIDMFIPGIDTIGGFSMCSAPDLLTSSRIFHLAIKFSQHPPAYWVHSKCQVGDSVVVRAGGDFFYNPESTSEHSDLLLLAGGVGINPLYSILQHFVSLSGDSQSQATERKAALLYSARTIDELLFREELIQLKEKHPNVNVELHSTQETGKTLTGVTEGHLDESHIKKSLQTMDKSRTDIYICGPSSFISAMESHCLHCSIPQHRIYYEKWW